MCRKAKTYINLLAPLSLHFLKNIIHKKKKRTGRRREISNFVKQTKKQKKKKN